MYIINHQSLAVGKKQNRANKEPTLGRANFTNLEYVETTLSFIETSTPPTIRVYPKLFGSTEQVPEVKHKVKIYDCREFSDQLSLDIAGFEVHKAPSKIKNFYDTTEVIEKYYPEVQHKMEEVLSAHKVIVFDHNVRSQVKADAGQEGVREPVEGAHNDYTLSSGPRRIGEVLKDRGYPDLISRRCALVNFWRPIIEPVEDIPLAICDAQTTTLDDFVTTKIEHFQEENLSTPTLTGEIYSFKYSPKHRWFYVPKMKSSEVILLKCYDSADDGRACFTGHTGFLNPNLPKTFTPRESIETRTVVVF